MVVGWRTCSRSKRTRRTTGWSIPAQVTRYSGRRSMELTTNWSFRSMRLRIVTGAFDTIRLQTWWTSKPARMLSPGRLEWRSRQDSPWRRRSFISLPARGELVTRLRVRLFTTTSSTSRVRRLLSTWRHLHMAQRRLLLQLGPMLRLVIFPVQ